jgi:glycosyltransferase involved in cell wall biosynthesis
MVGGGEYSFLDLLRRLPAPWKPIAIVPHHGELGQSLEESGIQTYTIALNPIRPWFITNILGSLRSYYNLCRRRRPKLIYANGSRAAFYGGILGRILGIPMIWHCRIADRDMYLDFILRRLSSRIVVNSRATAKRFMEPPQPKVRVVYNGVNISWFSDKSVSRPELIGDSWKVILVVARVSRWKRHDLAMAAFEQAEATDTNLHLVCVGSRDVLQPTWWKYLQERSQQSKVSDRIHWVDQTADIRPWYNASQQLLLCSENEPFGRVIVEAMACGLPVVAARSGGIPEIVRHNQDGILVTPGKVDEFASAVSEISNNDSLRERLSRSAKKRADDFNLELHVTRMIDAFEDTIRNWNSRFHISIK